MPLRPLLSTFAVLLLGALTSGCGAMITGRRNTIGTGPALITLTNMEPDEVELRPGVTLEGGQLPPEHQPWGLAIRYSFTFHDVQAIRNIYTWYFDAPDAESQAVRLGAGWPGLIVGPFLTPSIDHMLGIHVALSQRPSATTFEGGVLYGLWMHWSDPDWKFDLGVGTWVGADKPLGPRTRLGVRGTVQSLLAHGLVHNPNGTILTARLVLSVELGQSRGLLRRGDPPEG